MTLKELSQLYHLAQEIERDTARLEELRGRAAGTARAAVLAPRALAANTDRLAEYAAEIADLQIEGDDSRAGEDGDSG